MKKLLAILIITTLMAGCKKEKIQTVKTPTPIVVSVVVLEN